jgi:hypothetical protein
LAPGIERVFPEATAEKEAVKRFQDVGNPEQQDALTQQYAKELNERETRRRVELLAKFFGRQWPQSEVNWMRLMFMVCAYFEVPGFKIPGKSAGAPKKWDLLCAFVRGSQHCSDRSKLPGCRRPAFRSSFEAKRT